MTKAKKEPQVWMAAEVAGRLGISTQAVHKLDAKLRPRRAANGFRLYDEKVVEVYAREREAARRKARK